MSELLMFSVSLKKKKRNLPTLTQTNSMNAGQFSAQFFLKICILYIIYLASFFIFVLLAYIN